MQPVYPAARGYEGLLRLARAWHARVIADEVVSQPSAAALIPTTASGSPPTGRRRLEGGRRFHSHTATRPRWAPVHSANGPYKEMDSQAIACFDQALTDVGMAGGDRVRKNAARLLRVGDHHHDVPESPVCR